MHIQHENNEHLNTHNPFKVHYEQVKRCPKCSSVFITERECEACGFQFNYNPLGEPLGEKSFYSIRESYWSQLSSLERSNRALESKKGEKAKRYISKIILRYNDLLDFFYDTTNKDHAHHNLYFYELKDIILELISYDVPEKEIWSCVTKAEGEGLEFELTFYQRISEAISEGKRDRNKTRVSLQSLLSYRLGGAVKIINVFFFALTAVAVISGALAVYRFLNL